MGLYNFTLFIRFHSLQSACERVLCSLHVSLILCSLHVNLILCSVH